MQIESVILYRDVQYTEDGHRVPGVCDIDNIGSVVYTFTSSQDKDDRIRVSKDRMFAELRLPVAYTDIMLANYIAVIWRGGADGAQAVPWYGWVDDIRMLSDDAATPVSSVRWHVDAWRTFVAQPTSVYVSPRAQFGSGKITRIDEDHISQIGAVRRPQSYPYRYMTAGQVMGIVGNLNTGEVTSAPYDVEWIYVVYTDRKPGIGEGIVETFVYTFPVSKIVNDEYSTIKLRLPGGELIDALPMDTVLAGGLDETLGLDPQNLRAVYLSPYGPNAVEWGVPVDGHPVIESLADWKSFIPKANFGAYTYVTRGESGDFGTHVHEFLAPVMTDDMVRYRVTSPAGDVIGELPWGVRCSKVQVRSVVTSSAGYVSLRFIRDGVNEDMLPYMSASDGLTFNIPMIPIEITENGWSTYNYTGARQADIDQMRLDADRARVQGHMGSVDSAINGAIGGALISGPGAIIGGVAGAAANSAMTEVDYHLRVDQWNPESQRIMDYRAAHQSNGLLMSGGPARDVLTHCQGFAAVLKVTADPASQAEYGAYFRENGYETSQYSDDCASIINAVASEGGAMQIQDLVVFGVPPAASRAIREMLARGVRVMRQ